MTTEKKTAYLFDVDGTLVVPFTDELLPDVKPWFDRAPADALIGFATNQGGVGFRVWLENSEAGQTFAEEKGIDPTRYETEQGAKAKLMRIENQLTGGLRPMFFKYACFAYLFKNGKVAPHQFGQYHLTTSPTDDHAADAAFVWFDDRNAPPEWRFDHRKPEPGMLLRAAAEMGADKIILVGDSGEDSQAVEAAMEVVKKAYPADTPAESHLPEFAFIHRDVFFAIAGAKWMVSRS